MLVTIKAASNVIGTETIEGVNYDLVTIKEINKRNGANVLQVKVKNGKRSVVFSSGIYNKITVQDDESGRYLLKYNRE